jgi:hypothetical protein
MVIYVKRATPLINIETTGATAWLNSVPLAPDDLAGHVVIASFGTYTCINP